MRAGFVAQEEVQTYVSKGAAMFADAPRCPGCVPKAVDTFAGMSAAQKKNAKRKEKKAGEGGEGGGGSGGGRGGASSSGGGGVSGGGGGGGGGSGDIKQATKRGGCGSAGVSAAAAAAVDEGPADPAKELEKKVRATKKKIKSCEEIIVKTSNGGKLNEDQAEKLSRLPGFQAEVEALEAQLARLPAA